jgi:hypothetical protein
VARAAPHRPPAKSLLTETLDESPRRPCPVGVPALPIVAELSDRALLAVGNEDRVEAEAAGAARLRADPALEHARSADLAAVGRDRDELADVARSTIGNPGERLEDPLDVAPLRPAGGLDAGAAAERDDLEPGVLAQDPLPRRADGASVECLRARVLAERLTGLRRVLGGVEERDRPARKRRPELAELVLVLRGETRGQRCQRASLTSSNAATSCRACERRSRSM